MGTLLLLTWVEPARGQGAPPPPLPASEAQTTQTQQYKAEGAGAGRRSSLFLYLIDGLRSADVPAFGCPVMTTPTLTRMMEQGTTFLNQYAASPWSFASAASLMTSLYPASHGLRKAGDVLPGSAVTLAEILKDAGYQTALFTSQPLVGAASGLQQGFDFVEEIPGPLYPAQAKAPGETSASLNRRVLAWLAKRKPEAPVFVVVVSSDLEEPLGAPEPEGNRFIQRADLSWYREIRKKLQTIRPGPLSVQTGEDLRRLNVDARRFATAARQVYQGALYFNDMQVRALRDSLQTLGVLKDSIFALTSTRGEEFLEHGQFGHGGSLYDAAIRIPLVLTLPSPNSTPSQVARMTDNVDFVPTVLRMLQLPVPATVQGSDRIQSSSPENRAQLNRPAYSDAFPAGDLSTGTMSMVAVAGSKYISYVEPPAGVERPDVELFRMGPGQDDWEAKNWAGGRPDLTAQRRETLAGWKSRCDGRHLAPDSTPPAPDPRLKEILRALGYLQAAPESKSAKPASPAKRSDAARTP